MPANLIPSAIAGAILFGIYKYAPSPAVKAMALGAAGAIVAKQIPYVQDAM